MNNIELLDNILLSDDVVNLFHHEYESNVQFKEWLLSILPMIDDCVKQQQNHPWHKYNVMDHILHSIESMNGQTKDLDYKDRRLLSYVMFYHDIGKPKCHSTRIKDGKEIDSFFNHYKESARVANNTAHKFGFSDYEVKVITKLVFKHDIFMYLRLFPVPDNPHLRQLTPQVVKDEIKDLDQLGDGAHWLNYLIMIGRSDNMAQNEKMTANSFRLLDKFKYFLNNIK